MTQRTIEFLRITPLRGPNIWTYRPAVEAWVDIGDLEDSPSNTIPGFYERLSAWLPSLIEHKCSVGERGGFLQRVREGTWPAHILEHVTLELQNLVGQRTSFGKARSTSTRGVYKVVVRSRQEDVTRACLHAARDLVMAAIEDRPYELAPRLAAIRELAEDQCLGPSTACIVDAATERRIPFLRLNDGNLVQLGYGLRSRRIWTAETDRTGAIAESISRDKDLTKRLLSACGVPVPEGREVDDAEDAWSAAEDIGLPVVVKPTDANHGRGVFTDLNTRSEITQAYGAAVEEGSGVMVERFVRGNAHRLLVVGNRVVAATRGKPLVVVGDGRTTVRDLIEQQINSDPRCGEEEEFPLEPLVLEREPIAQLELERQGLTADAVPAAGRQVLVKRQGDLAYDETDEVHPEVGAAAALAARVVGLDIAGIDIVAENIALPLDRQGGAIVEVNAGPGLLMHLKPAEGRPRPVGEAIVDHLFPPGPTDTLGRIPVVGITGSRGKTAVAQLVARILQLHGRHVGLACSSGLYLDRRHVQKADAANWSAGHRVLLNRSVDTAVIETGARSILAEGLAYDRCQVAVVTNLDGGEALPEFDVAGEEQLFGVLRTLVDVVLPEGVAVLNAEDAQVLRMANLCDGEVLLFATRAEDPALINHRHQGGRAVFLRQDRIVLATGASETELARPAAVAVGDTEDNRHRAANILAAVAAGWALGIAPDVIGAAIDTFGGDPDSPTAVVTATVRHKEKGATRTKRKIVS
jgi:cyanophycin synthetase